MRQSNTVIVLVIITVTIGRCSTKHHLSMPFIHSTIMTVLGCTITLLRYPTVNISPHANSQRNMHATKQG